MIYHAKPDKKQIKRGVIRYGILALLCLALYYSLPSFRWMYQIGWLIFVGILLFLLVRYGLSEYIYQLEKDGIYITRVNGKNKVVLNVIPNKNYDGIADLSSVNLKKERCLNYCASYKPQHVILIRIKEMVNHQKYIMLEADDDFKQKIIQWHDQAEQEEKID